MKNRSRSLFAWLALLAGVVIAIVGVVLFLGINDPYLSKFSADGRDTSAAIIAILIGLGFAMYGAVGVAGSTPSGKDEA